MVRIGQLEYNAFHFPAMYSRKYSALGTPGTVSVFPRTQATVYAELTAIFAGKKPLDCRIYSGARHHTHISDVAYFLALANCLNRNSLRTVTH
eukprot:IDg3060t1